VYLTKTSGNLNPRGEQPQSNLQISTVRSFEGGLNVTDTDLNMSPKYAKTLDNFERGTDGSQALRPGTVMVTNQIADASDIVNHTYFAGFIWTVQASGNICAVDGAGNVTVKHRFPGDAVPWPTGVTFVDFTIFNSDLIIANGRDKPLIISGKRHRVDGSVNPNYLVVQYLADFNGSNINTPIGKFVIAHGRYTVIAGVTHEPNDPAKAINDSVIFISNVDTSGTWQNDPLPNDAIRLDLGPRVSLGSATITGMVAYRDKLLVTFERGVLPINLGVYDGSSPAKHTPTDDGFVEEFGCLSHRSLVSVGDDTFFNDNVGVNSISRINVFNTLRPVRISHLIDPLITEMLQSLTTAQVSQYVFSVYDIRNFRYMLFIPRFEGSVIAETVCFSYTNIPTLKIQAWARLRGWVWQSACRTALQNIIYSRGNKLYAYNFDSEVGTDRLSDPAVNGGRGENIKFEWELPWADFKHRMFIKYIKYIAFDTSGEASFTVEAYADNIVTYQGTRVPILSMEFLGGDGKGYGNAPYGNSPYGGGRRTRDERLYGYNTKFKLLKLRIVGETEHRLRIVSISIAYLRGGIRR